MAQALRLAALLRRFGLSKQDVVAHDVKALTASVRTSYYALAKEKHPDLVAPERKKEAAAAFAELQNEFSETNRLLQEGVRPSFGSAADTWQGTPEPWSASAAARYASQDMTGAAQDPHWSPSQPPEFDTWTRARGMAAVLGGGALVVTLFRQGNAWAYSPSAEVKAARMHRDPMAEVQEWQRKQEENSKPRSSSEFVRKGSSNARGVSDFYAKRGAKRAGGQYVYGGPAI